MEKIDANSAAQTTKSLPKLKLTKENVRVLGVRSGVKTGIIMGCPATCFIVTGIRTSAAG